jgi:hypothetical protein
MHPPTPDEPPAAEEEATTEPMTILPVHGVNSFFFSSFFSPGDVAVVIIVGLMPWKWWFLPNHDDEV